MINGLLQWDTLQKIFLNTIFISIPEEFYIIMFTLILMGEFDYWKEKECRKLFDRWDYIRVFVPTVGSALLSNILRYTGVNANLVGPISLLSALILICVTGDIWRDASALKWIGKAFGFLMFALLSIISFELIYVPFILYSTGKTVPDVNNNILLNFEFSIPERIIEYTILAFLTAKRRTLLEAKILATIFESKILAAFALILIIFNLAFMLIMLRTVAFEKLFINLSSELLSIVVVGISIFPFLNISIFIAGVYYIKNKESEKQKNTSEKLRMLMENIKLYINNEKYDNIKWKLREIEQDMEKISVNLFAFEKKGKGGTE